MGHHGLVVLICALLPVAAFAAPPLDEHDLCAAAPERRGVLPRGEAPPNTRVWVVGAKPGTYTVEGGPEVRSFEVTKTVDKVTGADVGNLAPGAYVVRRAGTEVAKFNVSGEVDRTPPPRPAVRFTIADYKHGHAHVELKTEVAGDVILVELEIESPGDPRARPPVMALPGRTVLYSGCGIRHVLWASTPLCLQARAVDVAGNRSAPLRACTQVNVAEAPRKPTFEERTRFHWHYFFGSAAGLMLLAGFMPNRKRRARFRRHLAHAPSTSSTPLSPDHVAQVARWRRRSYSITAVVCACVATAVLLKDLDGVWVAGPIAMVGTCLVGIALRLTHIVRLLADRSHESVRIGVKDVAIVRGGELVDELVVTDLALARAAKVELPRAEVRSG